VPVPRRGGPALVRGLREWHGRYGWRATTASWNILGSHDSARIRTLVGSPEVHRVAAGLQFTLPGVPMLFAGDEIGLEGVTGEDARRPFPWDAAERWDGATLRTYAGLARLRHDHEALRRGGLRWAHVGEDVLVFVREHPAGSVLVAARRSAGPAVTLPAGPLGWSDGTLLLTTGPDGDLLEKDGEVTVPATDGPAVGIWRL
jgi:alpha-glucosidase